jgi:hypothetical protein
MRDHSDWKLNPRLFRAVSARWGPFSVDLFASRANSQLHRYFSYKPDGEQVAVDAFLQDWSRERPYGNPPFAVIGRVCQKVAESKNTVTLIVPLWRTAAWWPMLLRLLVDIPRVLPRAKDTFLPGLQGSNTAVGRPPWDTLAVQVCGDPARQQDFQRRLLQRAAIRAARPRSVQATRCGGASLSFAQALDETPWPRLR